MPIVKLELTLEEEAHAQQVMEKLASLPKHPFIKPYEFVDDEDKQLHEAVANCIKTHTPIMTAFEPSKSTPHSYPSFPSSKHSSSSSFV